MRRRKQLSRAKTWPGTFTGSPLFSRNPSSVTEHKLWQPWPIAQTEWELLVKSELSGDKASSSAVLQKWPSILPAARPSCLQGPALSLNLRFLVPSSMGKALCGTHHSGLLSSIHTFQITGLWVCRTNNWNRMLIIFFPCRLPVGRSLNDLPYPSWLQQLLDQVKPLGGFFLEKISFEQPWALYIQVPVPKCMSQHIVTPVDC